MLSELSSLAYEKSSEKRRELLQRISDLFYDNGRNAKADSELEHFAAVVNKLLVSVDGKARAAFAELAASNDITPKAILLNLANDSADIAAPVLRNAALTDAELIQVASTQTRQHRIAIAERDHVTEPVTDSLISFGELEVLQSLVNNPTAAISSNGFDSIGKHAAGNSSLRERLCLRGDLPAVVAQKLLPFLDGDARTVLQALIERSDGSVDDIMRRAVPEISDARSERAKRRLDIKAKVADGVVAKTMPDQVVIAIIAATVNPIEIAFMLSEMSGVPEQQAANAVVSVREEPLALIAKAIGLLPVTYAKLNVIRCGAVRLPTPTPAKATEYYATIETDAAERAIRFVKVRTSLMKAADAKTSNS